MILWLAKIGEVTFLVRPWRTQQIGKWIFVRVIFGCFLENFIFNTSACISNMQVSARFATHQGKNYSGLNGFSNLLPRRGEQENRQLVSLLSFPLLYMVSSYCSDPSHFLLKWLLLRLLSYTKPWGEVGGFGHASLWILKLVTKSFC